MGDHHDIWLDYWEDYAEREPGRVRRVAQEYPVRRGLEVSYSELLDRGIPHRKFRYEPGIVLADAVDAFEEYVRSSDIEDAWERDFSAIVPHVVDLPDAFNVDEARYLEDRINELVRVNVRVSGEPESKADLIEAAFVCPDGHVTRVHQAHVNKQFIDTCGRSDCDQSVWHEPNRSLFTRIQRAYVSGEHFEDVMVVLGGVQNMQEDMGIGDEYRLHAVVRAETMDGTTHGDVHLGGLYVEEISDLGY